jgi:hypothetical protein
MLFCHLAQAPKRSTLSYANAHRTWELYERLFYDLLQTCKGVAPKKKFRFKNKLMDIDSSVIELCIEMFDWAKYRKAKGAAKLHLVLDHDGYLPAFADLTEGREADINIANKLHFAPGTIVVMDRGYIDYSLFERWTDEGVFFVTRTKKNTEYYWQPRQKERPLKPILLHSQLSLWREVDFYRFHDGGNAVVSGAICRPTFQDSAGSARQNPSSDWDWSSMLRPGPYRCFIRRPTRCGTMRSTMRP